MESLRGLGGDKVQGHSATGSIIDKRDECEPWTPALEPVMRRAVDLYQLSQTRAARTALMYVSLLAPLGLPETIGNHPVT